MISSYRDVCIFFLFKILLGVYFFPRNVSDDSWKWVTLKTVIITDVLVPYTVQIITSYTWSILVV